MTNTKARIAIIEDNPDVMEELIFYLQAQGYTVWGTSSAEEFWKHLHFKPADIVLLDIGLPGEDGFSVLDHLRSLNSYGMIVISARGSQQDKLQGLSLGADAYLIKPINFFSLVQTIDALWQRQRQYDAIEHAKHPPSKVTLWTLSRISLNAPCGTQLPITPQEYELLDILFRHNNEIFSKERLCSLLFGYATEPDTHRIDVILSRLRTKARNQETQLPIRSIFGKGIVLINR